MRLKEKDLAFLRHNFDMFLAHEWTFINKADNFSIYWRFADCVLTVELLIEKMTRKNEHDVVRFVSNLKLVFTGHQPKTFFESSVYPELERFSYLVKRD